ncbi:hypothetical protein MKZ38_006829 [Zalerion maritima]|uniref:Uncharacterized protein n=1 Tax=Zalerion maritima TaxID=339359 RepID=A0AAD5RVF9_9PEZI|nr:hypothetical protein MKZ38_006829 [Zalerion maritima]
MASMTHEVQAVNSLQQPAPTFVTLNEPTSSAAFDVEANIPLSSDLDKLEHLHRFLRSSPHRQDRVSKHSSSTKALADHGTKGGLRGGTEKETSGAWVVDTDDDSLVYGIVITPGQEPSCQMPLFFTLTELSIFTNPEDQNATINQDSMQSRRNSPGIETG